MIRVLALVAAATLAGCGGPAVKCVRHEIRTDTVVTEFGGVLELVRPHCVEHVVVEEPA